MKHVYFIRHGETEMNAANIYNGQAESPLTDAGRAQAARAGLSAKDLGIDYIISSPLSRAHHTAELVAAAIDYPADKIELNDLLLERHFGSLEGQPWSPETNVEDTADAESAEDLQKRAEQIWQHIQSLPAENILVVSHGSTGRMLRHVIDPSIPFHNAPGLPHFPNAEIVQLV